MAFKQIPTNLNFFRGINPSHGEFSYPDADGEFRPAVLVDQTVRGTIGNFIGESDNKLKIDSPNIQRVDICTLPLDVDTFRLRFSLSFTASSLRPGVCNDEAFLAAMERFIDSYRGADGLSILAERYAQNVVNASWMWRNRGFATDKQVVVAEDGGDRFTVAVANDPDHDYTDQPIFRALSAGIRQALGGETAPYRITVEGHGRVGPGQELFPSQEFVQDESNQGNKSRHLHYVWAQSRHGHRVRQAAMHPQKLGNRIRRVDDWYAEEPAYGRIPAEPYGVVQDRFTATRPPSQKNDLYSYLKRMDELADTVEQASSVSDLPPESHYVMACFIRGGVFGGASNQ